MNDFTTIEYLKEGNERQRKAYKLLKELGVFEQLVAYKPILTGTIPIEIDIPESDLDIICQCENLERFLELIFHLFGSENEFEKSLYSCRGIPSAVASFKKENTSIEIFAQNIPTKEQYAYKHMLKEYTILAKQGDEFRKQIIQLKKQGIKTEPAFAKLLGLIGDPYEKLLEVSI